MEIIDPIKERSIQQNVNTELIATKRTPKLSVVIPLYNKGRHIERTLNSILAQTIQDFEIIIVNDGSSDSGPEVVKSLKDTRINLINQDNAGVSAARNRGIQESKADLIALLDADDEWKPVFLETILKLREKYPEAGAYVTAYNICESDGRIRNPNYKAIPLAPWEGILPSYFMAAATGGSPVCSSVICIPRKVFSEIGGFQVGAWWGEDDDLWGRIALRYPISFSWQIGSTIHRDADNRACNLSRPIEEHPFIKTAREFIINENNPTKFSADLKECVARYQIRSASHNISNGKSKHARKNLKDCKTKLFYREKIYWYFWAIMPTFSFSYISKIKKYLFGMAKTVTNPLHK